MCYYLIVESSFYCIGPYYKGLKGDDDMAAMDQEKLSRMCTAINGAAEDYVNQVKTSASELASAFNENWVSNSSKALVAEIVECLNSLASAITTTFATKNDNIVNAVRSFNQVENESILYSGFRFGKPDTSMNINNTLPNNKVGVADGADLNSINTPMNTMVQRVNGILDNIVSTVRSADALDIEEQTALTNAVQKIKNHFDTEMTELEQSLKDRMSNEIMERDALQSKNVSELQG